MTWGYSAIAAATVTSAYLSSEAAGDASDKASQAAKDQLAFEKQRYDDWKAVYGGIQENLSEFYSNITPEFYETQGLENFRKEQDIAMDRVKTSLAQRGIEDSGVSLALENQMELQGAEARAEIRAEAPMKAAKEQSNFLSLGLGVDPSQSQSNALANQSQQLQTQATIAEQQAGQAIGAAVSTTGTALADYFNKPAAPTPGAAYDTPGAGAVSNPNPTDYSAYA